MVYKDSETAAEIQKTFGLCLIAYQTGTMPNPGGVLDQSADFIDVFTSFIMDFKITELSLVIEAIGKMFKGK